MNFSKIKQNNNTIDQKTNNYIDPSLQTCCRNQPYIGLDQNCNSYSVFCLEHNAHPNPTGLLHAMMPLKQFKTKINTRKFVMQQKTQKLITIFNNFMEQLIAKIKQIKVRKSLQLNMLWVRELAESQQQYQMIKRMYRGDFSGIKCKQVYQVYFKILNNDKLFNKQVEQIQCYKGIARSLQLLQQNKKTIDTLAQKITQIQGVLSNGSILKKMLAQKHSKNTTTKQILLQTPNSQYFSLSYNKCIIQSPSNSYRSFFSKYPINFNTTYTLEILTRYNNIMIGICQQKQKSKPQNIHYQNDSTIMYNLSNGNTYFDGMYTAGKVLQWQDQGFRQKKNKTKQIFIKLRVNDRQMFVMTGKNILTRVMLKEKAKTNKDWFICVQGRSQGDEVVVWGDVGVTADSIQMMAIQNESVKQESVKQGGSQRSIGNSQRQSQTQRSQSLKYQNHQQNQSQSQQSRQKSQKSQTSQNQSEQAHPHIYVAEPYSIPSHKTNSLQKIDVGDSNSSVHINQSSKQQQQPHIYQNLQFSLSGVKNTVQQPNKQQNKQYQQSQVRVHRQSSVKQQQEHDSNWMEQKAKHLKDIMSQVNQYKKKAEEKKKLNVNANANGNRKDINFMDVIKLKQPKLQQISLQRERLASNEFSNKSTSQQNSKIQSLIFKNKSSEPSNYYLSGSKIKINISQQQAASSKQQIPYNIQIKNSNNLVQHHRQNSKLRRGSDNIEISNIIQKQNSKAVLQMSQSMLAQANVQPQMQKIRQIKTPPQIKVSSPHSLNDSYDFL